MRYAYSAYGSLDSRLRENDRFFRGPWG